MSRSVIIMWSSLDFSLLGYFLVWLTRFKHEFPPNGVCRFLKWLRAGFHCRNIEYMELSRLCRENFIRKSFAFLQNCVRVSYNQFWLVQVDTLFVYLVIGQCGDTNVEHFEVPCCWLCKISIAVTLAFEIMWAEWFYFIELFSITCALFLSLLERSSQAF